MWSNKPVLVDCCVVIVWLSLCLSASFKKNFESPHLSSQFNLGRKGSYFSWWILSTDLLSSNHNNNNNNNKLILRGNKICFSGILVDRWSNTGKTRPDSGLHNDSNFPKGLQQKYISWI